MGSTYGGLPNDPVVCGLSRGPAEVIFLYSTLLQIWGRKLYRGFARAVVISFTASITFLAFLKKRLDSRYAGAVTTYNRLSQQASLS